MRGDIVLDIRISLTRATISTISYMRRLVSMAHTVCKRHIPGFLTLGV